MWVCIAVMWAQVRRLYAMEKLSRTSSNISPTKLAMLMKENIQTFDDDAWKVMDDEYAVAKYSKFLQAVAGQTSRLNQVQLLNVVMEVLASLKKREL